MSLISSSCHLMSWMPWDLWHLRPMQTNRAAILLSWMITLPLTFCSRPCELFVSWISYLCARLAACQLTGAWDHLSPHPERRFTAFSLVELIVCMLPEPAMCPWAFEIQLWARSTLAFLFILVEKPQSLSPIPPIALFYLFFWLCRVA